MTSIKLQANRSEWRTAVKTIGSGLLFALGMHTFVAEVRMIPSDSMTPTLQVGDQLVIEKLSYLFVPPQRGDVVVFKATPELESQNIHNDFIKRIIGTPGDTVSVKQGQVYVNAKVIKESDTQAADYNYGPVTLPANQYFVLGDNRNHSYDSHFWGFVPREDMIGRAICRIYPVNRIAALARLSP